MTDERKTPEIEEADFITLEFDDGAEIECEIMGVFDYEDKEYIALIPNDGTDDIYIYGYKEVGEDDDHNNCSQQGVEHTPRYTQNTALILYFKVTADELFNQKFIFH